MAKWVNIDEVLEVINKSRTKGTDWIWPMNTRCKYISLRIDMRDGHCLISDRDDIRISLEQLKYQHNEGV